MTDKVLEQLLQIRDGGQTNMFDVRTVQRLAHEAGFYELVMYIEEHPHEYCNFILKGKEEG